jgi:hypothetical protein
MRWTGHIARSRERLNAYKVRLEILKERDHLGDLDLDGRMIKLIVKNRLGKRGLDSFIAGMG